MLSSQILGLFFWLYQGRLHRFAVGLVKAPPHQLVVGFFLIAESSWL